MDAELKAKWVAKLRSGTVMQHTKGALRYGDEYCCIGVLGEVVLPGLLDGLSVMKLEASTLSHLRRRFPDDVVLPSFSEQTRLAQMNDGDCGYDQHSFAQIADYIEAHL